MNRDIAEGTDFCLALSATGLQMPLESLSIFRTQHIERMQGCEVVQASLVLLRLVRRSSSVYGPSDSRMCSAPSLIRLFMVPSGNAIFRAISLWLKPEK